MADYDRSEEAGERTLFEEAIGRLLARRWSLEHGSEPRAAALSTLWAELCDAGVGGLGEAADEVPLLIAAMIALGEAAAPVPLAGAALAHRLLAGDPAFAGLLADVASGSARIAVAYGELSGDRLAGTLAMEGSRVVGRAGAVEDAATATHFLVLDAGKALVVASGDGITIEPAPGLAVPPLAAVTFAEATGQSRAFDAGCAAEAIDLARLLLTARAFGAQRRAFGLADAYVRVREQFGQPIGKFQAVQHKLADCAVRSEIVRLLIADAERVFAHGGDTQRAVAELVAVSSPALRQNALEIQHAFGAVGFAEEHEAPRHFKRVHADTIALGGASRARAALGAILLDPERSGLALPIATDDAPLRAVRDEVRDWLATHLPERAAARAQARDPDVDMPFLQRLGEQGWLSAHWPREAGGRGAGAQEQFALMEELRGAGAPVSLVSPTAWIVAPAIIAFGSDTLKRACLPAIAEGRMTFCLGYSEPQAGSDLAALATRAVPDGEDYVVNGQKIWTSLSDFASHIFLAARTGGGGKHGGISLFVVPLDTPGITRRDMRTLHNKTFANIFFDDVRVPAAMRVGEENGGWKILSSALAAERVLMGGMIAALRRTFEGMVDAARARPDMATDAVVRDVLGGLAAELAAARALALRSVSLVERGEDATIPGAMTKLYSGDLAERIGEAALDLFGIEATLAKGAADALVGGEVSQHLRTSLMLVIGGGTAEIQRNLIAQRGLGLPR